MEEKKEHKKKSSRLPIAIAAFIIVVIGGGIAAGAYMLVASKSVYIENSTIEAPTVNITPGQAGILKAVYVSEGDIIPPNTVVAQVDTQLLKSTEGGLVITVNKNIGKNVGAQDIIVETIDPSELRVVGQLQEDKGLKDVAVGERATFTVDAFGSKQYSGVVDEVSPTSNAGDVVFNVSDKRQEQNFDVKVRFDVNAYSELKNGMSAKLTVYKN